MEILCPFIHFDVIIYSQKGPSLPNKDNDRSQTLLNTYYYMAIVVLIFYKDQVIFKRILSGKIYGSHLTGNISESQTIQAPHSSQSGTNICFYRSKPKVCEIRSIMPSVPLISQDLICVNQYFTSKQYLQPLVYWCGISSLASATFYFLNSQSYIPPK